MGIGSVRGLQVHGLRINKSKPRCFPLRLSTREASMDVSRLVPNDSLNLSSLQTVDWLGYRTFKSNAFSCEWKRGCETGENLPIYYRSTTTWGPLQHSTVIRLVIV